MSKFPIKKLQEAELQATDEHCIIKSGVLRLIAREMDSAYIFKQHQELGRFLLRCGISKNLCQGLLLHKPIHITESPYSAENILRAVTNPTPNPSKEDFEEYSREMLIYRILVFYSCGKDKNKKILFNVIENLGNPLLFHGDAPRAMRFHKKISQLLIDAGYVIKNGVVKKMKSEEIEPASNASSGKVRLIEKDGVGWLQFHKSGKLYRLGRTGTRCHRLIQSLCEPHFGVHKTLDAVFEAIRQDKDGRDQRLTDPALKRSRVVEIINLTIKELQKKDKVPGKLHYIRKGTQIWLEEK